MGSDKAYNPSHKSKNPKAPKGKKGGSGSKTCPDSVVLNDTNAKAKLLENSSDKNTTKCFDTSQVTSMFSLFKSTDVNADISSWDVSSVTNMAWMFYEATKFNGDVSDWDVSSVTAMDSMFYEAIKFNSDVSDWDVSSVIYMNRMFIGASEFYHQMCGWTVQGQDMFDGSLCSVESCIQCTE